MWHDSGGQMDVACFQLLVWGGYGVVRIARLNLPCSGSGNRSAHQPKQASRVLEGDYSWENESSPPLRVDCAILGLFMHRLARLRRDPKYDTVLT
jgi:hypothetical protein